MLLGYEFTAVYVISLLFLILGTYNARRSIRNFFKLSKKSVIALLVIVAFFTAFALIYIHPAEQLYFDENIYQGAAINILMHGNALWCQAGSGYLHICAVNAIYHDPVEWSFFIAIAFALFGISTYTSFAVQLLAGMLSVVAAFVLAYSIFKDEKVAIASSFIMALMPPLFIWARTEAVPDLPFMLFSMLTFAAFFLFFDTKDKRLLGVFLPLLLLTVYMRIEAILLLPLFLILFLFEVYARRRNEGKSIWHALAIAYNYVLDNLDVLILLLVVAILLVPQFFYISYEFSSPDYGQSYSNQKLFSLGNFYSNAPTNLLYFLGWFNYINYYPTLFPPLVSVLAVIGAALMFFGRTVKRNRIAGSALVLWFLIYMLFYDFFYAGSATFGVDSRFMLQLTPALVVLAAYAIVNSRNHNVLRLILISLSAWFLIYLVYATYARLSMDYPFMHQLQPAIYSFALAFVPLVAYMVAKKLNAQRNRIFSYFSDERRNGISLLAFVLVLFVVLPFALLSGEISISPLNAPQQGVIYPSLQKFFANYSSVPRNCLIFSFTPDIWYEQGYSALQEDYLYSSNETVNEFARNYSCVAFDYGYWCNVPPYNTGCSTIISSYKTKTLAFNSSGGVTFAVYQLLNYSP